MGASVLPPFAAELIVDAGGVILECDAAAGAVLGMADSTPLVGRAVETVLPSELAAPVRAHLDAGGPHGAVFDAAGRRFIVRPTPRPDRFAIEVEDVAARTAAWRRLHLTQTTIDRMTDMIIWLDPDGRYVFVNPGATALLGYSAEELSTLRVVDVDPMFDEQRWREHWQDIVERKSFTIETVNTTKSGVRVPIEVTVNYVEHQGAQYNCSIVRDISERKRFEAQLLELNQKITRLSNTDELTGIANRRRANAALAERITAHIVSGDPLSVIMIDVDHFKAFNDHYGHAAGDDCLCRVAHAVDGVVTEVGGLAARYGGEEFLCLLPAADEAAAHAVAVRIQQSVADLAIPHAASGSPGAVTLSIGVLTVRDHFDAASILATVDEYLYRAKRQGRNRIVGGEDRPMRQRHARP